MDAVPNPPSHVVVVIEENRNPDEIIGRPLMPFFRKLACEGVLFTNSHGVARPSQPNYFAMFSGSTHGVRDNGDHFFTAPTLASQLKQAGYSFAWYNEKDSPRKHNAWLSFEDAKETGRDFADFPTDFNTLPTVSFVTPGEWNNMHDGSRTRADQWLEKKFSDYAEWAKTNNSLLIVTFDEGNVERDNIYPTIVVGAGVAPLETGEKVNQYSLLRMLESFYGLPLLGEAQSAPVMDLRPTTPAPRQITDGMCPPSFGFLRRVARDVAVFLHDIGIR